MTPISNKSYQFFGVRVMFFLDLQSKPSACSDVKWHNHKSLTILDLTHKKFVEAGMMHVIKDPID